MRILQLAAHDRKPCPTFRIPDSQDPLRPGARGVCHDPEKPFFGNLPRVSFRSPSPRFLQTPRSPSPQHATATFRQRQPVSDRRQTTSPSARATPTCLPAFQCRSTAFRQARQLQDPLNSASLTSADSHFRETPCSARTRAFFSPAPHLLLSKKPPCVLSWTPLFSDSSYVGGHTSRRPWQRRPYMAHNRLRACVKFVGSSSAIPVFLAPSEHVPQLHISSTAPLLPAKLKPRFSYNCPHSTEDTGSACPP